MKLTQEQINLATNKIEEHLKDIGLSNNFDLINITEVEENSTIRIFTYNISNPTFNTTIQIEFDFSSKNHSNNSTSSFSWMDYKKITE